MLPTLTNIEKLELNMLASVSRDGREEVAAVLQGMANRLSSLAICPTWRHAAWLQVLKPTLHGLQCFKLGFWKVLHTDDCPALWSSAFRDNTFIRRLELSLCGMSNAEIAAFSRTLPTMRSLQYFDVAENRFNSIGAAALLEAVNQSENLEEVFLGRTRFEIRDDIRDAIFYTCKLHKIHHRKLFGGSALVTLSFDPPSTRQGEMGQCHVLSCSRKV
jgi:hypothetical protein